MCTKIISVRIISDWEPFSWFSPQNWSSSLFSWWVLHHLPSPKTHHSCSLQTTLNKLHFWGSSSSFVRLSLGFLGDLFTNVGCRNSMGLSNGKVMVLTPQSLLGTRAWVASVQIQRTSNPDSSNKNEHTCYYSGSINRKFYAWLHDL